MHQSPSLISYQMCFIFSIFLWFLFLNIKPPGQRLTCSSVRRKDWQKIEYEFILPHFRVALKDDSMELYGDVLGLKLESNGIRVLEPFDTCVKFSNVSGTTKIHASTSDIYMNFSFSILKLFLAIQDDILEFMRMTTNKFSVVCSQFDKVGTIQSKRH